MRQNNTKPARTGRKTNEVNKMKNTKTTNTKTTNTKATNAKAKTTEKEVQIMKTTEATTQHIEDTSDIVVVDGIASVKVADSKGTEMIVKADSIFNEKEVLPFMTYADDYKGTEIGNLIDKYNNYGLSAKVSLLEQGGILKQISDKKLYKGMSKTFDDFLKAQGIPKASAYRYIGGYKLCCDAFGKVRKEVLALGSAVVNKANKIGFTRENFQEVVDKAAEEKIEVTPANITELADKYGIEYDKEKAKKELPQSKKKAEVVEVKPEVKEGYIRFTGGKSSDLWFDIHIRFASKVDVHTAEAASIALADNYGDSILKDTSFVAYLLPRNVVAVISVTKLGTVTTYTHKLTKAELEHIAKCKAEYAATLDKAAKEGRLVADKAKAEAKAAKAEAKTKADMPEIAEVEAAK